MIPAELVSRLLAAASSGAIPAPIAGEDMDTYRFQAALAGAVVALHWHDEQVLAAEREEEREERATPPTPTGDKGRPGDVTGTSQVFQQDLGDIARRLRGADVLPMRPTGGDEW
jgi:hypothetical protein